MKLIRKHKVKIAVLLGVIFLSQTFPVTSVFAITGHNSMPEYRSFEPVATTNMVNLNDGSFTYNLPLLDIPNGYPINLSYHSNEVSPDAMASWVGLGWNINPGAINRVKRGFPDDYNNKTVTYFSRMPANWTVAGAVGLGLEIFGDEGLLNLNLGARITYNNYNGIATRLSMGFGFAGVVALDFSYAQGRFGFNPEVNPAGLFQLGSKIKNYRESRVEDKPDLGQASDQKVVKNESQKKSDNSNNKKKGNTHLNQINFSYGGFSAGFKNGSLFSSIGPSMPQPYPTSNTKYAGFMTTLKFDIGLNLLFIPLAPEGNLEGSFTKQKQEEEAQRPVYGYMHSGAGFSNSAAVMDYFTENEKPYEKRDKILGIPYPNNDIYLLTGEAMGGSFRPFRSEYGHYRPNDVGKSEDIHINVGAQVHLPSIFCIIPPCILNLTTTLGFEIGGSYHWLQAGDWDFDIPNDFAKFSESDSPELNGNENWFFRFSHDLGGDFVNTNDQPYAGDLSVGTFDSDLHLTNWDGVNGPLDKTYLHQSRNNKKRSSYISYNTKADVLAPAVVNGHPYKRFEKKLYFINGYSNVNTTATEFYGTNINTFNDNDQIIELATINDDGAQYVYGLPVRSQKEKQISYSLRADQYGPIDGNVVNVIGTNIDSDAKRKIGYSDGTNKYVTTYLLTQITNPDYVDRELDGPTKDDFGSFTRFGYVKHTSSNWYKYRNPYKGLNLNYGSLSEKNDDMGSYTYGEKELYYLRCVASKTHVAIFSLSDRLDGWDTKISLNPTADELLKGDNPAVTSLDQIKPKKLDRIDLYSINDVDPVGPNNSGFYKPKYLAIPIKTVHFEYDDDYPLCTGMPNSAPGKGKLTLKKIWFEYEGKKKAKISPYFFNYSYPDPATYPAPYSSDPEFVKYNTSALQNPDFSYSNTDRWGSYQRYADKVSSLQSSDFAKYFPYVNQNYTDPIESGQFDPSAYLLKQIILPSGGEIHIHYEQNDYQFVQNKRAMVMIPLSDQTDDDENGTSKPYYLDMYKLGIDWAALTNNERAQITHDLFEPMNVNKERIYFNFLFNLVGNNAGINQSSEYIEGFARIDGYGFDVNKGPYFKFKNCPQSGTTQFHIDYPNGIVKRERPKEAAKDFYNKQRRGKVNGASDNVDNAGDGGASGEDILWAFINLIFSPFNSCCDVIKPEYSYVRLQMPLPIYSTTYPYPGGIIGHSKFGGGVRVKHLLMYDPNSGGNASDKSLYGQEFSYKSELNGAEISSGVATNEPPEGRRENPLVQPMDKEEQSKFEAFLYGRDMYSQEGPLGESLLPPPSIGYAKVTVNSIHKGATSTGSEVHEFYTCREFPMQGNQTIIEAGNMAPLSAGASVGVVSGSYSRETPHLSQGFSFKLFEMHGKPKRISKYSAGDSPSLMAQETYEYFSPGESVQVMNEDMTITPGNINQFGKETEMLSERRKVEDVSIGGDIGVDVTISTTTWVFGFFILPLHTDISTTVGVSFNMAERTLRTHSTNKIISYPAIVKRVTNFADGVTNVTENLVLDKMTGKPVVVKSYDDFTGKYLNHDFLAGYSHKNMRPKAINQKMYSTTGTYNYFSPNAGYLTFPPGNCDEYAKFIKGDLLELTYPQNSSNRYLYHVEDIDLINLKVNLLKSGMGSILNPPGGTGNVNTLVVRSGYTNQLNAKQGNVLLHGDNPSPINPAMSSQIQNFIATLNSALQYLIPLPVGTQTTITYKPSDKTICINGSAACGGTSTPITITMELSTCFSGANAVLFTSPCPLSNQSTNPAPGVYETCSVLPYGQNFNANTQFVFVPGCGCLGLMPGECTAAYYYPDKIIKFCDDAINSAVYDVVTASASKYSDEWFYNQSLYPPITLFTGANDFERGLQGKWRVSEQYTYRENLNTNTAIPDYRNYNSGKFTMHLFNYDNYMPPTPDYNWVLTNKVNMYSPNGEPVEDENILQIKSTAKYGYNNTVPVLVAQNAADHSVAYESFENLYLGAQDHFEDNLLFINGTYWDTEAHTGRTCVKLTTSTSNDFNIGNIALTGQTDLRVRGWFNKGTTNSTLDNNLSVSMGASTSFMRKIASSGNWELYEGRISGSVSGMVTLNTPLIDVLMDDIRIQPGESEMVCYVYDNAKRLVAVFDDQHFASLYQYNAEGLLVRKLKETTQGIKTISETQYNSKGVQPY